MNYNENGKNENKTINNNIFSHKKIHYYKKRNIALTTPKKNKYISNFKKNKQNL